MKPASPLMVLSDLATYRACGKAGRASLAQTLASRMGAEFEPDRARHGTDGFVGVRHVPSGLVLVAVPGGTFTMGLSDADLDDISSYVPADDPWVTRLVTFSRPAHAVTVAPFLCVKEPVTRALATTLLGSYGDQEAPLLSYGAPDDSVPVVLTPQEAARARDALGTRLLSEAELEYVQREGGRVRWVSGWNRVWHGMFGSGEQAGEADKVNGFGVAWLGYGEWAADAWHDTYVGAPRDGSAWEAVSEPEVYRASGGSSYPWQTEHEVLLCHAAFRARTAGAAHDSTFLVRFARDLPLDA